MRFVYTPQDGFWAARKNGVKVVFGKEPTAEQAAFAEKLCDSYKDALPRICGYLFTNEGFGFGENAPRTADSLKLDFIRVFNDDSTELWYQYYLPYEDRKVSFAIDVGFTGCFEEFTEIFIDA